MKIKYDCAKLKTAATLIFRKYLFLFYQAFKQQCVLFNSSTYCKIFWTKRVKREKHQNTKHQIRIPPTIPKDPIDDHETLTMRKTKKQSRHTSTVNLHTKILP